MNSTLSRRKNFQITAGGYRFVNTFVAEPETFLGPAISTHQNAGNSTDYGNQSQMHRYSTDRSVSIAT